jgi:hypothetical protein
MAREAPILLSRAEIIVLSDALARLDDDLERALSPAERQAFWTLGAALEKANPIALAADYRTHVEAAQAFLLEGTQQ